MSGADVSNLQFQQAVSFVTHTRRHVFVTGKAGTGKTTFLRYIREQSPKKMAVVAPTGVAAIHAGGVTMHSLFQLPMGIYVPGSYPGWNNTAPSVLVTDQHTLFKNLRLNREKIQLLRQLELLVIDEVSMLRADLLDAIDVILRHTRNQYQQPFGGVQVVYIGDLYQLPPVTGEEEWRILQQYYRSPFFFDAQVIQQVHPVCIELKKIYRQKDEAFIALLNNVRNNQCTPADLALLHRHYAPAFTPSAADNYILLSTHNYKADAVNQAALQKLPGELHVFEATVTGDFAEKAFPADKILQLKTGAQVMFIKNDKGEFRRYYNGKIGHIGRMDETGIYIVFPGETNELLLEKEEWRNIRYKYNERENSIEEEELGSFAQYPIRLAWAVTIHKSQGLTFEKAIIDAGASFAPGQVYVALSRLTSLEGLVLRSPIQAHNIYTDERILPFMNRLAPEELLPGLLQQGRLDFALAELVQCFRYDTLFTAWQELYDGFAHLQLPAKTEEAVWVQAQLQQLAGQQETARKFCRQLEQLIPQAAQNNYALLNERVQAGGHYFLHLLQEQVLQPLAQHIEEVKIKPKTKKYVTELLSLQLHTERKKHRLQQAMLLAAGLYNGEDLTGLLQALLTPPTPPAEDAAAEHPPGTQRVGESRSISLQLFKEGQSIEAIAQLRNMAAGTIEGHLVESVKKGELAVTDLVPLHKIAAIEAALTAQPGPLKQVKELLGDTYSYAEIRAVAHYLSLHTAARPGEDLT
jgi:hypothetical protein